MNVSAISSLLQPAVSGTTYNSPQTLDSVDNLIPQDDAPQLSPEARWLSRLAQLQQSDPEQFKTLTGQISDRLAQLAQKAATNGQTDFASRLQKVSDEFKSASTTGQMPTLQPDQSQAQTGYGGHHGHHHHHQGGGISSLLSAAGVNSTDLQSIFGDATNSTSKPSQ